MSDKLNGFGTPTVFRLTIEALESEYEVYIAATHMEQGENRLILKSWEEPKSLLKRFIAFLYIKENQKSLYDFMIRNDIELLHLHSYQKDLSPSVLQAIKRYKRKNRIKVVQTLHDYHLICPNNSFYCYSKESACHDCLEKGAVQVIKNCCDYRGKLFSFLRYLRYLICFKVLKQKEIVDEYIVPSDFSEEMHNKAEIKTHKIYNPVDNFYLPFARGLEEKENRIVFFGRLSPEKNIPLLIDAFSKIAPKEEYILDIVGDGPQRGKLEELVKKLGIAERVVFHGRMVKAELANFVSRCKISVSPSKCYETFGLTIIEAIFLNVIPVVSATGALKEVVERAGFNTTFESDNVESLKRKLEEVIEKYDEEFSILTTNKPQIIKDFAEEVYKRNIKQLYDKIIIS